MGGIFLAFTIPAGEPIDVRKIPQLLLPGSSTQSQMSSDELSSAQLNSDQLDSEQLISTQRLVLLLSRSF